jgi:hypothetical protein
MNAALKLLRDKKLESLADSYAREGFSVLKHPTQAVSLPFDLGSYSPDLIVSKDGIHLIIEVKTSASQLSVDRLQSIAEEVAKHPGWRFMVATVDDIDARSVPTEDELPEWHQLRAKLEQAAALIQSGFNEPLVLYLCSIVEAASRRRALECHIPVATLRSEILLKHLYSQGEVSMAQLDALNALWELRNRIAHGGNEAVDSRFAQASFHTVSELFDVWHHRDAKTGAADDAHQAAGQACAR